MRHRSVLIAALAASWFVSPGLIKCGEKNNEAAKVLTEAYRVGENLDPQERGYFLARLTQIAAKISHEKTEDWCSEQFALADKITPEWNRVATQKNALTALAGVNPIKAVNLLGTISPPPYPESKTPPPEDLRADSAIVIYPSYFRRLGTPGLVALESQAAQIGASGEYPYRAMLVIMEDLHRLPGEQQDDINKIFTAAHSAYGRGSIYANADQEFLTMLEGAQFLIPEVAFQPALHTLVENLLANLSAATPNFQSNINTAKGSFHFANRNQTLLFRVFPLMKKFEPKWAAALQKQYATILEHAGDDIEDIQQAVGESGADQERLNQQLEQVTGIARIRSLSQANPWGALEIAQRLSTAGGRISGFSDVLPAMIEADPVQARAIYSRQLEEMKAVGDDPIDKLTASVALAKGALYSGDVNGFSDLAVKSFDHGVELFAKSKELAITRPGYAQLTDLTEFCTEHGAIWIVDSIRQLPDSLLKAYLFVAAARGITEQKVLSKPFDPTIETKREPSVGSTSEQARSKKPN